MNILHDPQFDVKKTTAHYTKKDGVPIHYVCTTDLDESDVPVDIYYREDSHPDYRNYYFGLYSFGDKVMICKAELLLTRISRSLSPSTQPLQMGAKRRRKR